MEVLNEILSWISTLSVILCSLAWIACSWICLKVSKSTTERVRLCEELVLLSAERISKLEYKLLMNNIEGNINEGAVNDKSS